MSGGTVTVRGSVSRTMSTSTSSPAATPASLRLSALTGSKHSPPIEATVLR
jgi:hypothetical protein